MTRQGERRRGTNARSSGRSAEDRNTDGRQKTFPLVAMGNWRTMSSVATHRNELVSCRDVREWLLHSHSLPFPCNQFPFLPIPSSVTIPISTPFPWTYSHYNAVDRNIMNLPAIYVKKQVCAENCSTRFMPILFHSFMFC